MDFYITDGLPLGGLVQPWRGANALGGCMDLKFDEFMEDLRVEMEHCSESAWLTHVYQQIISIVA